MFCQCPQRPVPLCLWCLTTRLTTVYGFHQGCLWRGSQSDLHVCPVFYCPQTFFFPWNAVWSTESKRKARGYRLQLSPPWLCRGGWIDFWESGTWKLSVGKSQLIMDHFRQRCIKVMLPRRDFDRRRRWFNGWLQNWRGRLFLRSDSGWVPII